MGLAHYSQVTNASRAPLFDNQFQAEIYIYIMIIIIYYLPPGAQKECSCSINNL